MARKFTLHNGVEITATDGSMCSKIDTEFDSINQVMELYSMLTAENLKTVTVTNVDSTVYGEFPNRVFGSINITSPPGEIPVKAEISLNPPPYIKPDNTSEEIANLRRDISDLTRRLQELQEISEAYNILMGK